MKSVSAVASPRELVSKTYAKTNLLALCFAIFSPILLVGLGPAFLLVGFDIATQNFGILELSLVAVLLLVIWVLMIAYWLFFILWLSFGIETIKCTPGSLLHTREVLGLSKNTKYEISDISNLGPVESVYVFPAGMFPLVAFKYSYPNLRGSAVRFDYRDKKTIIYSGVDSAEAKSIAKTIAGWMEPGASA